MVRLVRNVVVLSLIIDPVIDGDLLDPFTEAFRLFELVDLAPCLQEHFLCQLVSQLRVTTGPSEHAA